MEEIKQLIAEGEYESALKKLLLLDKEYLFKIQCLYELGKHQELIVFFEQIVDKIENDYFEILGFYILSLIELEEYDKSLSVLNEELSMPYIEADYQNVLNTLYDDVVAKKQAYLIESGAYDKALTEEKIADILTNEGDYNELLNVIMKLDEFNIRKILTTLDTFLQEEQSPILKTFVLEVMIKQQISDTVLVIKDNLEYEFMPIANQLVFQNLNYITTRNLLNDHLAKFPSYLNMAMDILDMFVYIIYPNEIDVDESSFYAAMIEYYIFSLNIEELQEDFEEFYGVNTQSIINGVDVLINVLESEEKYAELS